MRALLPLLLALSPLLAGGGGTLSLKGQTFLAEVASTDGEKAKGLMYRSHLAADRCMVFLYEDDGYHGIWMKNCLIALDVIWVDASGKIVEVVEKAPPCSPMLGNNCPTYGGTVPARYFVEFPVGTFKRLGLKVGDTVAWELKLDDGTVVRLGAMPKEKAKPVRRKS